MAEKDKKTAEKTPEKKVSKKKAAEADDAAGAVAEKAAPPPPAPKPKSPKNIKKEKLAAKNKSRLPRKQKKAQKPAGHGPV
jgi:hypothetical protein